MLERIFKVNELIKEELSQIILREIEFPSGVLVTITRVGTTPDLKEAKVFISVMPEKQSQEILEILQSSIYEIQGLLNKRLVMKFVPKIRFREERQTREAGRIEELLERLKKEGK